MTTIEVAVTRVTDDDGLITSNKPTFESFRDRAPELAEGIREIAGALQNRLDQPSASTTATDWSMDGVKLTFALALEAGAGVLIARTSASATFSVEISWTRGAEAAP